MPLFFPSLVRIPMAIGLGGLFGGWLQAQPNEPNGAAAPTSTRIEAERFTQMYGVTPQPCSEGGIQLGELTTGDWVLYRDVDLGAGVRGVAVRVQAIGDGGMIEIRFGDSLGPVIGTIEIPPAGDDAEWETFQTEVWKIAGTQSICLRFIGEDAFSLNWIEFAPSEQRPATESVEAEGAAESPTDDEPGTTDDADDVEADEAAEASRQDSPVADDEEGPTRVSILFRQEAERWTVADDATILPCSEGGFALHPDRDAASAGYEDFAIREAVNVFAARIAVVGTGASLELRTRRPDGPILAILPLRETGSLDTFATYGIPAEIPAETYDLVVVFRTPDGQSCALNWFGFVQR